MYPPHLVSPNRGGNAQYGWGPLEVMCISPVIHQAVQVLGLGRSHHPPNEPLLHLGFGTIAVALGRLLAHYLQQQQF